MFYGQCWKCGERWGLGTAPTCTCKGDDDDTMCYRSELEAAVKAEREACANIDWTPILRNNGMVTWGDAETLADLVSAAIRARGKA